MIHGTIRTAEQAARVVRIFAPAGYRILGALETLREGDLQGSEQGWSPLHPANVGRRAGGIISAARRGRGVTEDWCLPARPEDYLQIVAIDRQALEQIARSGSLIQNVVPGLHWECTTCGEIYPKGTRHRCGTVVGS